MYADDVSAIADHENLQVAIGSLTSFADRLLTFAAAVGLVINPSKTQFLAPASAPPVRIGDTSMSPVPTMTVLGSSLDTRFCFAESNKAMVASLRSRLGVVRRIEAHIPRGKLLNEITHALIWGKLRQCAWVTRALCAPSQNQAFNSSTNKKAQVFLNDAARLLLYVRRSEHVQAKVMAGKLGFLSVNQVVVQQASLAAWKCANLRAEGKGPLDEIATTVSTRTRAATEPAKAQLLLRCNQEHKPHVGYIS